VLVFTLISLVFKKYYTAAEAEHLMIITLDTKKVTLFTHSQRTDTGLSMGPERKGIYLSERLTIIKSTAKSRSAKLNQLMHWSIAYSIYLFYLGHLCLQNRSTKKLFPNAGEFIPSSRVTNFDSPSLELKHSA
jgi:hypothetical protein